MYGDDSLGRKVSLLNDDPPTTTTTKPSHIRTTTFVRPGLPNRAKDSISAASSKSSSLRSREGSGKSSRSSISCSPRQSPPTPPLVRLDSRSSINTPSPMTPQYPFDPMDPHGLNRHGQQQSGLPYYTNSYQHSNGEDGNNPYPSMQDNAPHNYYPGMNAQQSLPPLYGYNETLSQQATLSRLQNPSLSHYTPPPPYKNSLSSSMHSSLLASLPSLHSANLSSPRTSKHDPQSATSTTSTTFPGSASDAPLDTDPSTPITTTAATTTASSSNPKPTSATTATANANGTPSTPLPKKKYPCPHAKDSKCTDTFTTSGHAARHGKKHTGEKNVNCPTCGKAFTRKDNMKQHERTHKPGHSSRSAGSGGGGGGESPLIGSAAAKGRKRTMSSSTMTSINSAEIDADGEGDLDVDMDMEMQPQGSSSSSQGKPERPAMGRSKLSEILEQAVSRNGGGGGGGGGGGEMDAEGDVDADGEGESPGLDALANAAAGEGR